MNLVLKAMAVSVLLSFLLAAGCGKQENGGSSLEEGDANATPGIQIYQVKGTVKGIDKNAAEITIAHEEIPGLMSAMTMDFAVKDVSMLEDVAPGDSIDFELERNGSDLTVNKIIKSGGNELADGGSVYKQNCAECHGEKGAGTEKGLSFLEGHALEHPREDFLTQVREGEDDKMPSFKDKLSEKEIEAVVTYVRDVLQKDLRKKESSGHKH